MLKDHENGPSSVTIFHRATTPMHLMHPKINLCISVSIVTWLPTKRFQMHNKQSLTHTHTHHTHGIKLPAILLIGP